MDDWMDGRKWRTSKLISPFFRTSTELEPRLGGSERQDIGLVGGMMGGIIGGIAVVGVEDAQG